MIDETFKKYFKFPLIQREKFLYVFGNDGNANNVGVICRNIGISVLGI